MNSCYQGIVGFGAETVGSCQEITYFGVLRNNRHLGFGEYMISMYFGSLGYRTARGMPAVGISRGLGLRVPLCFPVTLELLPSRYCDIPI